MNVERDREEQTHEQTSNIVTRNWRDLIRPRGIQIETETLTDFYGKFTCEPLERGYGITLGNSLRRMLLSSLQGAAITAVRDRRRAPRVHDASPTSSRT